MAYNCGAVATANQASRCWLYTIFIFLKKDIACVQNKRSKDCASNFNMENVELNTFVVIMLV